MFASVGGGTSSKELLRLFAHIEYTLLLLHPLLGWIFPVAAQLHKAARGIEKSSSNETLLNVEFHSPSQDYKSHFRTKTQVINYSTKLDTWQPGLCFPHRSKPLQSSILTQQTITTIKGLDKIINYNDYIGRIFCKRVGDGIFIPSEY